MSLIQHCAHLRGSFVPAGQLERQGQDVREEVVHEASFDEDEQRRDDAQRPSEGLSRVDARTFIISRLWHIRSRRVVALIHRARMWSHSVVSSLPFSRL